MNNSNATLLPRWLWLGIPVVVYFGHYVARAVFSNPVYDAWFRHESGVTETATVALLALSLVAGLYVTRWAWRQGDRALTVFFALFALGCLYFGGEEASWGQHWFGWATPEEWRALNNQAETNLHNSNALAGSLLDQLPRNLMTVGMLIGGAILPLVRRARGTTYAPGSFRYWIMPGIACVAIGFIAPLSSVPEKIFEAVFGDVPFPFDIDAGEVKELMFALFLALYIAEVIARIRDWQKSSSQRH